MLESTTGAGFRRSRPTLSIPKPPGRRLRVCAAKLKRADLCCASVLRSIRNFSRSRGSFLPQSASARKGSPMGLALRAKTYLRGRSARRLQVLPDEAHAVEEGGRAHRGAPRLRWRVEAAPRPLPRMPSQKTYYTP